MVQGESGTDAARGETASVPGRVWRGTATLIAGRIWGAFVTLAILWLLTRSRLPTAEVGRFTFYVAVFAVVNAIVDFGTSSVAVQRTAHDRWALVPVVRAVRRIRVGMAAIGFLLVVGGAWAYGEPGLGWIVAAALYPFAHAFEVTGVVLKNEIAWGIPVAVRAGAAATRLALVAALLALGAEGAGPFVVAYAAGGAIDDVALHLLARRRLPRPTIPVRTARGILVAAAPLGIAALCQQAYFYVDNLFVRSLRGEEELAHYNVAVRLMSFLILGAVHSTQAALPWLARRWREGDLAVAASRLGQPLAALAGLGCGLLLPWTGELLALLFGDEYRAAGPAARWLLLAVAVVYAGAPLLTAVVASGRGRAVLWVSGAALLLNCAGNAWLVPRHGIAGAGAATLATELAVAVGAGLVLARGGARPLGPRPLAWLAGPALLVLAAWLSARLPLAGG